MIDVKISKRQSAKLEAELKAFAARAQVSVAETVAIIGTSVAKELARKVQPFGLSNDVGKEYMGSIAKQVHKAARYAEFKGLEGDIKSIHRQLRSQNAKFQVLVRPPAKFQPKRKTFDKAELKQYVDSQMAKAGLAKAGWIQAGESIDSPLLKTVRGKIRKIKGVPRWVRHHVNARAGESKLVKRQLMSSSVLLTNKVDYAYAKRNSNHGNVQSAIADGYRRSITAAKRIFQNLK
jgi:hypothetical protein